MFNIQNLRIGICKSATILRKIAALAIILVTLSHLNLIMANGDDLIDGDNFLVEIEDCQTTGDLCINIPLNDITDYIFEIDGQAYPGLYLACDEQSSFSYDYQNLSGLGTSGPYNLNSWIIDGNSYSAQFQDLFQLVAFMNVWDSGGNWSVDLVSSTLVGGNSTKSYSDMDVTTIATSEQTTLSLITSQDALGTLLNFAVGNHVVQVTQISTTCTDMFTIEVVCLETEFVSFDVLVGQTDQYCLDFSQLPGNIQGVNNITIPDNPPIASYAFANGNTCIDYTGLMEGIDTICIVSCDDLGFCDTTKLEINVEPIVSFSQEANLNVKVYQSQEYCFVLDQLNGNIVSTNITCEGMSESVDFDLISESYCSNFSGMSLGSDDICYSFTDSDGANLNYRLFVNVLPPQSETIDITIELGEDVEECLDTSEIAGTPVNVYNDCPESSGNSSLISINNVSLCVEAESLSLGTESGCIIFCDINDICDTAVYRITIIDNSDIMPPVANSDVENTGVNEAVSIEVCSNDVLNNMEITEFSILSIQEGASGPNNGTVTIENDCSVSYQPDFGFCGADSFSYLICNDDGCDTGTVDVTVSCSSSNPEECKVFTAFSPNGDGINDTFKITGLDSYPGNQLTVFNRWGQIVYKASNYQSDWRGTWDTKEITDGTYYYMLQLNGSSRMSGYFQLQR